MAVPGFFYINSFFSGHPLILPLFIHMIKIRKVDVKDIFFRSELAPFADKYFISDPKGFLLNFSGLASETLKLAGVNEVYDSGLSTYSDPARFYSYRRDKVTGRHGAVIYKQ